MLNKGLSMRAWHSFQITSPNAAFQAEKSDDLCSFSGVASIYRLFWRKLKPEFKVVYISGYFQTALFQWCMRVESTSVDIALIPYRFDVLYSSFIPASLYRLFSPYKRYFWFLVFRLFVLFSIWRATLFQGWMRVWLQAPNQVDMASDECLFHINDISDFPNSMDIRLFAFLAFAHTALFQCCMRVAGHTCWIAVFRSK